MTPPARKTPADIAPYPLDPRERRKRRRELIAIAVLLFAFVALTIAEFRLTKLSSTLPFVNSIFFFGLLNFNIVILIALVWLVFRNIGKLFIERRRKILGSRLKTKLVIAFLAFSIIPTLVLFIISALYINSSFDKWFSLKIQNTLQASLEITRTYYRNTDQNAMHFAEHIADGVGSRLPPTVGSRGGWLSAGTARLDRGLSRFAARAARARRGGVLLRPAGRARALATPGRIAGLGRVFGAAGLLSPALRSICWSKAFSGEKSRVIQHIGTGDLIRCLVPVHAKRPARPRAGAVVGVMVVSPYIPVSLVNKVDEIASVLDDYNKATNPLKYPMKTTYLVILIMITLVILFVAIWIGLYMAREITVPVERLVHGAQAVGAGNLDVAISAIGHDEIAVLVRVLQQA